MSLESSTVGTSLDAIRAELARAKLAASTFNFIVWIDDPARRDWIRARAGMLSEKHPSFTLIFDNTGVRAGRHRRVALAHAGVVEDQRERRVLLAQHTGAFADPVAARRIVDPDDEVEGRGGELGARQFGADRVERRADRRRLEAHILRHSRPSIASIRSDEGGPWLPAL